MEFLHTILKYGFLSGAILSSIACIATLYLSSEKEEGKGFWTRRVEITSSNLPIVLSTASLWLVFFLM